MARKKPEQDKWMKAYDETWQSKLDGYTAKGTYSKPIGFLPPRPFTWWKTGLPDTFAGRQLLEPADADRLVAETGVKRVLDLRQPKEWAFPWKGKEAVDRLQELGITRIHLNVQDVTAPSQKQFAEAMAFLEEGLANCEPVYIHCRAGKERTACILLAHAVTHYTLTITEAWGILSKNCDEFKPLSSQVNAALKFLNPATRHLPCSRCHMPLEASAWIGRVWCLECEIDDLKWRNQQYEKEKNKKTVYPTNGNYYESTETGLVPLGSTAPFRSTDPVPPVHSSIRNLFTEAASQDVDLCYSCGEAPIAYGTLCSECRGIQLGIWEEEGIQTGSPFDADDRDPILGNICPVCDYGQVQGALGMCANCETTFYPNH